MPYNTWRYNEDSLFSTFLFFIRRKNIIIYFYFLSDEKKFFNCIFAYACVDEYILTNFCSTMLMLEFLFYILFILIDINLYVFIGDKKLYQRYRFVPLIMGLKVYKHLYGFPMPFYNFVVPDEPQWPYWMIGMPLGEWSSILRVQQKMLEEHYPHRKDMLNSLEYAFWLPPGNIPQKYFRSVK